MIDSKLPAGCEEAARRPPKSGVATATSTRRPRCTPNSTTFSRQLTCWSTTSSPSAEAPAGRRGSRTPSSSRWRSPKSSWDCRTTASHFLALAGYRLSHLFAYLPRQSGYNKRLRALTPQIERAINYLAFCSPGWCDQLRLLDSTPVPCAASRETVRRSEFAGDRSLRLLPLSLALLLGLSPLSALRERRDPDRLRARPGKCSQARGRARDARAGPARRPHRHRRQGLRRRRVRGLDGRSRSRVPSSRSQGRAAPIRIARARAPVDRIGLLDLQGTARPRAPRRPHTPGPVRPRRAAAPRPRRRAPA